MRRFSLILLFVFALAGAAFAADDVIKIGVFNCLTGQNAFGGQLELEGTQLAHKEIPEVLGKKVEPLENYFFFLFLASAAFC